MHNNVFKIFFLFTGISVVFPLKKCFYSDFCASSIAAQNGGVSGPFCSSWRMISGRRDTAKRLPVTRTNNLPSHSRSKHRAMTFPGVRVRVGFEGLSPLTPYHRNSHAEISIQLGAIFSYYVNTTLIIKY